MPTRRVEIIAAPFHAASPRRGMGAGPLALLGNGRLEAALAGVVVRQPSVIDESGLAGDEIGGILAICARVAERATQVLDAGDAPLLLTGNCNHAHLAAAALAPRIGAARIGVVWLDAHADFDTPENTESSFFDGMGLSVLTGEAYRRLAELRVPGFAPLSQRHILLVGVRDLEPYQQARLAASAVGVITPAGIEEFDGALERLAATVDAVYLHLDLDSIDPRFGRANEYAAAGGLELATVLDVITRVARTVDVPLAAITAYNPDADPDGKMLATGRTVAVHLARALAGR